MSTLVRLHLAMYRVQFAIVLFGALLAAAANASFWVAVGSFQDAAVAERVVGEASGALHETFSVQQAETSNGIVQRVATGPFASREEAETIQDQAKASGYVDSWIFSRSADDAMLGQSSLSDDSNLARVLNDDDAAANSGGNLGAMEDDLIDPQPPAAPHQRTLQEALKQVHELPTQIPPGYQLNQLYRDGQVPTPEEPQ